VHKRRHILGQIRQGRESRDETRSSGTRQAEIPARESILDTGYEQAEIPARESILETGSDGFGDRVQREPSHRVWSAHERIPVAAQFAAQIAQDSVLDASAACQSEVDSNGDN